MNSHFVHPIPAVSKRKENKMSEQRLAKKFEELKFSDDFMFGKVMEDKELCREVLECLLQRPVGELREVQTQKEIKFTSDGKPIRLDVFNEDRAGVVYDAEMQNLNNHSIEWHALPRRSRFYQASIDVDFMNRGSTYDILPESNVMFICTFDPFKKGLYQYTFREKCDELQDLTLDDGTMKIFYNCCYEGDDIAESLKQLYEYIRFGKTESILTRKIDHAVTEGRRNEAWRTQYMKERLVIYDAMRELREEIEEEKKRADEEKRRADKAETENATLRKELEKYKKLTTV